MTAVPSPGVLWRQAYTEHPGVTHKAIGNRRARYLELMREHARLGKREHAILAALATYPQGRTQRQLAMLTGYSAKASTIGAGLSELRKAGYVTASGLPQTTEEGVIFARSMGVEDLPTGPALLDYWRAQLGERERKFLDVLIEIYPQRSTQAELAERCDYSPESSTVGAGMSKLRTLGLVAGWAASDEFMEAIE